MITHTLGFPGIEADGELKHAIEGLWAGRQTQEQLLPTARQLRQLGSDLGGCHWLGCLIEQIKLDGRLEQLPFHGIVRK